jgi:hypothetical protein
MESPSWPLFTPGKDSVPIVQEAGWAPGPIWTVMGYLAHTGIRSPDRPAHSQSLYRLSYPAHMHYFTLNLLLYLTSTYSTPIPLAASQHKRMTYTDCCTYRKVPPDDEQETCSKHVQVNYQNKVRVKECILLVLIVQILLYTLCASSKDLSCGFRIWQMSPQSSSYYSVTENNLETAQRILLHVPRILLNFIIRVQQVHSIY